MKPALNLAASYIVGDQNVTNIINVDLTSFIRICQHRSNFIDM